jgi:hypothetical protein
MKKLIMVLLISLAILLSSCGGLSELPFVIISKQTLTANGENSTQRIIVVTQTPSHIPGISPEDLSALMNVDYSEDVAFVIFFDNKNSKITKISQFKALIGNLTIWVQANFQASTTNIGFVNYQILTIKRALINGRGNVLVRLLDDSFQEKNSVSFVN